MSTTSRGRAAEDRAKKALEDDEYVVDLAVPEYRLQWDPAKNDHVKKRQYDRFGVADLIALGPDCRVVQVTHPSGKSERKKKLETWAEEHFSEGFPEWLRVELWVWQGPNGRGFLVEGLELDAGEWMWGKVDAVPVPEAMR